MAEPFIGRHTIYGADGEHETPYMTRVWIGRLRLHIFHRGDADPDPHDHPWDFWTFPLTSYVEDVTVPTFAEQSALRRSGAPIVAIRMNRTTHRRLVRAWRVHFRPATYAHRVLGRFSGEWLHDWSGRTRFDPPMPRVDERRIVTIVWAGRPRRNWGFLKFRDGRWCWSPWREYVFGGGKHAPCEPTEEGKR